MSARHPHPGADVTLDPYEARWPAIQGGTSEALVREAAKRRDTQLGQVARVALHLFENLLAARREAKALRATLDAAQRRIDALLIEQLADTNRIRALLDDRLRAQDGGPQ